MGITVNSNSIGYTGQGVLTSKQNPSATSLAVPIAQTNSTPIKAGVTLSISADAQSLMMASPVQQGPLDVVSAIALFKLNPKSAPVSIVDTSTNISKNFDALQKLGEKLKTVTQIGPTSALTITADQYAFSALLLSKMVGGYTLSITKASSAQLTAMASNSKITAIAISDTASNLSNKFSDLTNLSSKISAITQIGGNSAITISAQQYQAGSPTLAKFVSPYTLSLKAVNTGSLASFASNSKISSMAIIDSSLLHLLSSARIVLRVFLRLWVGWVIN